MEVIIINIQLDFSGIECDLGHMNSYTNKQCKICGEDFGEFSPHIDPKVVKRKEFMSPVFDCIQLKIKERKDWFKKLRRNEVSRIRLDEPFDKIQELISRLNKEMNKGILENVTIYSDNLDDKETIAEVKKFENFMISLIEIKFEAEKLQLTTLWKNMNNRLINSIRYLFDGYIDLLNTTVSPNLPEAQNLQIQGQEKIDFATNEINILGKIINNQNVILTTDIFADGEVNQSAILSLVFSNNNETITDCINETAHLTNYYFKELINEDFPKDELITLAPYMYMGTSVFDDTEYLKKIRIVLNILQKAMSINKTHFKNFLYDYLDKFLYVQGKIRDISTDFAFVLGNTPSDDMLMRHCIKWYKDLSEGVYKDASRLVYFSMNLVNNKEFEKDDILLWLGFGDIVGEFENQKKHKLNYLIEGVEKIIRHAEAHVDYKIKDGYVHLRNVIPRNKEVNELDYTYDQFFDITNKLAETIFAIICGIQIHLLNNSNQFADEIKSIKLDEEDSNESNMASIFFALSGIIIINETYEETDKLTLKIDGVVTRDFEKRDLGETIFRACAHSSFFRDTIDEINFSLYDADDSFKGNVIVPTKYLKEFKKDKSEFKEFNLLIVKLTSHIDDNFHENITSDRDLLCLKSLFVYLFEVAEKVNHAFRDKEIQYNDRIKNELRDINKQIKLLNKFLVLYKEYSIDENIYFHMIMLINQAETSIKHLILGGMLTRTVKEDFDNLKIITDIFLEFSELAYGNITKNQYLKKYLLMKPYIPKNLTVNTMCPCGSGKKYKKCCK